MDKRAERLECAWLLREAAWALKRYADRIERGCTAIGPERMAKAEAGAHEWMKRAQQRLAKFAAARRKYLDIRTFGELRAVPIKIRDTDLCAGDLKDGQSVEYKYRDGAFHVTRIGNPWRAGSPPEEFGKSFMVLVDHGPMLGNLKAAKYVGRGIYSHGITGLLFRTEIYAWRPA